MMCYLHFIFGAIFSFNFLVSISFCDGKNIQCTDESGKPVDWYYLYKLPTIKNGSPLVVSGRAYAYLTSESPNQWVLSNLGIDDKNSFPGRTLAHLYKSSKSSYKTKDDQSSEMWLMYNDQPPNADTSFYRGHTKGVIAGNENGGVWMVHSVPHYPPPPEKADDYTYPKTGRKNGQSFLCISMNPTNLDRSGKQLLYNNPFLYSQYFGNVALSKYTQLHNVSKFEGKIKGPPYINKLNLTSKAGTEFTSFAKASKFNKDLYDDFITDDLKLPLRVETWPNGPNRLHSDCAKTYHTENIDDVKIGSFEFSAHKDHSKWAISTDDSRPWTCVGDINRAKSQFTRGGGTVCLHDPRVHQSYNKIVAGVEGCSREPLKPTKDKRKKYHSSWGIKKLFFPFW